MRSSRSTTGSQVVDLVDLTGHLRSSGTAGSSKAVGALHIARPLTLQHNLDGLKSLHLQDAGATVENAPNQFTDLAEPPLREAARAFMAELTERRLEAHVVSADELLSRVLVATRPSHLDEAVRLGVGADAEPEAPKQADAAKPDLIVHRCWRRIDHKYECDGLMLNHRSFTRTMPPDEVAPEDRFLWNRKNQNNPLVAAAIGSDTSAVFFNISEQADGERQGPVPI